MKDYKNIYYQRIIYTEHPKKPGMHKSTHTFISARTGAEYEIHVDMENRKYWIKNMRSELLMPMDENRKIKNRNVFLRTIRQHIERLGVVFKREVRNRSFGRCEKGYNQKQHKEREQILSTIPTSNNGLGD